MLNNTKSETFCYIGTKPYGCTVTMVTDKANNLTAKCVGAMVRDGLIVSRVPLAEAIQRFGQCIHEQQQTVQLELLALAERWATP